MRAKFEAESTFYFVSAAKLRESTQKILPVMQELRGRDGWLERREMIWEKACAGSYSGKYLSPFRTGGRRQSRPTPKGCSCGRSSATW